jgi:hypothetical protein
LDKFDILMRNESWRYQVLLVQGYIPSRSTQKGKYSTENKVRSMLESQGAEAADQLTKSLARYAEKAYRYTSTTLLGRSGTEPPEEVKLVVTEMSATFVLDHRDKLIFLFSDHTMVEIKGTARKEIESFIAKEKSSREKQAAQAIAADFLNLLHHAQRRGVGAAESFSHFDVKKNGERVA